MSLSSRLITMLDEVRAKFALNFADRRQLVQSLMFLQRTSKATKPMLLAAADHLRLSTNPFDEKLRAYFYDHAKEEDGHDEWFKADIESEDGPMDSKIDWLAALTTGAQMYAMRFHHPAALLGYCAFAEGSPMPMPLVEMLEDLHGKTLLRTWRYHADNDRQHRISLFEMIDQAPDHLHELIESSAHATAHFWLASNFRVREGSGNVTFN